MAETLCEINSDALEAAERDLDRWLLSFEHLLMKTNGQFGLMGAGEGSRRIRT